MKMEQWDVIHSYTRKDAIEDGLLIDVSEMAKEAGISFPVAITASIQSLIDNKPDIEDVEGRTWDVIWMLRCAIVGAITSKKYGEDTVVYQLILNNPSKAIPTEISLKAQVHGGDNGEPVITVMLPEED